MSYLCNFVTKWHKILATSLTYIVKNLLAENNYIILFRSRVNRHVYDVIYFMINVILSYLLVMQ